MAVTDEAAGSGYFEAHFEDLEAGRALRLVGELDMATLDQAKQALEQIESDSGSLLIDLDELKFIDSTGLGWLLEVSRRNGGGEVRFTRGTGQVADVLKLTGLDEALPFA